MPVRNKLSPPIFWRFFNGAKFGETPEKEFSGTFNIRTTPAIHEKASIYAAENGFTLNQVVTMAMEKFLAKKPNY